MQLSAYIYMTFRSGVDAETVLDAVAGVLGVTSVWVLSGFYDAAAYVNTTNWPNPLNEIQRVNGVDIINTSLVV
jgi:hypothetical protein